MRALRALLPALLVAVIPYTATGAQRGPHGVYLSYSDSATGSLDAIAADLQASFIRAGWETLALYTAGVDRDACAFGARVLVVHSPSYARAVLARGPRAAYAVPVRLAVYQDEQGSHIVMANPRSLNRTMIAEESFAGASEALVQGVGRIVADARRGSGTVREYGQVRDRGLIGRTMGVMAGGPFTEKITEVFSVPGDSAAVVRRVARQVLDRLKELGGSGSWQIRKIYELDLAERGAVVLGVSGLAAEARAFSIVGAGADEQAKSFRCPGLSHAPAFPIEVVIMSEAGRVRVTIVNQMYRMKMYFEDAGKMKFAANMRMPGSIEDEIRRLVTPGVVVP